ncbi:hypothetical protein Lesp01_08250 [Lentzea sp. NBRC 102530]|nr:hypothetical protein Lesp01_08250 [Lentzea sp. NBRC 102530]
MAAANSPTFALPVAIVSATNGGRNFVFAVAGSVIVFLVSGVVTRPTAPASLRPIRMWVVTSIFTLSPEGVRTSTSAVTSYRPVSAFTPMPVLWLLLDPALTPSAVRAE